ncbi:uncharacterized protein BDV14DRAFT_197762 [Aspergillus stella-maris]|uniref:uncharacterized protein n=1 Tax=Aspergillus stella-maris TaxID=1810926 RepID=UPI003CCD4D81
MAKDANRPRPPALQAPYTPPTPTLTSIHPTSMTPPPEINVTTPTTPTQCIYPDGNPDQVVLPPPVILYPQPTTDYFTSIVSCPTWVECTHILLHEATAARYQRDIALGSYNPHHNPPFYNYDALYEGLDEQIWRGTFGKWFCATHSNGGGNRHGCKENERPVSPCTVKHPVFGSAPPIETNTTSPSVSTNGDKKTPPETKKKAAARAQEMKIQTLPTLFEQEDDELPMRAANTNAAHSRSISAPTSKTTPAFPSESLPDPSLPIQHPAALIPIDWETSFAQYMLDYHAHMHSIASARGCTIADAWEIMETERWVWRVEIARVRWVMEPALGMGRERGKGKWERRGGVDLS